MSDINLAKMNIKIAFFDLYEKERIEKITVTQICQRAGYNRSTFYSYFSDIYQVLDEIEEEVISTEDFENIILKNILNKTTKQAIMKQIIELYEAKNRYFVVLLGENGDPSFRSKLVRRIAPTIFSLLKCENEKVMKKLSFLMEYQSSGILAIITQWFKQEKPISVEELCELLVSITVNGMQKEMTDILAEHRRLM